MMSGNIDAVHRLIIQKMEKCGLDLESKQALKAVLKEFEIHMKVIEEQLEICKKDHVGLKSEITRLVQENRDLFMRLKTCTDNAIRENELIVVNNTDNSEAILNLERQLSAALEEKRTVEEMWKSSLNETEKLKEKLDQSQSRRELAKLQTKLMDVQQDYTEAIKILESKLKAARMENDQLTSKVQILESQLMQVSSQMAIITERSVALSNSQKEGSDWKSRYLNLEAKHIELDRAYQADKVKFAQVYEYEREESQMRNKLETALHQRDELHVALERCHERMAQMLRDAASDRIKVEEAIVLVEGALEGRNEAVARETQSTEEFNRLRKQLQIVEEARQKLAQETTLMQGQFDAQVTSLRDRLDRVEQERDRYRAEAGQWQRECERGKSAEHLCVIGPNKDRDNQLERVYHQLNFTETEGAQLRSENFALKQSVADLQERCNNRSREKIKLKHELMKTQQQCQFYQEELAVTTEKANLLTSQLHQASLEMAQLQSEALLQRDNLSKVDTKVRLGNTIELCKQLDDSYGQMNKKWKNEMIALTDRFDAKLKKRKSKSMRARKEEEIPEKDV